MGYIIVILLINCIDYTVSVSPMCSSIYLLIAMVYLNYCISFVLLRYHIFLCIRLSFLYMSVTKAHRTQKEHTRSRKIVFSLLFLLLVLVVFIV